MKVGDLVRDREDPGGEVGLIVRVMDSSGLPDVVVVKYSSARLFIHTCDLILVSRAKEREVQNE